MRAAPPFLRSFEAILNKLPVEFVYWYWAAVVLAAYDAEANRLLLLVAMLAVAIFLLDEYLLIL